jgi:hypothetical protein
MMKKKTERRAALVLLVVCLLIAGAVYSLGFVKYTFQVVGVNVAIYPAAFLALVGVVQFAGVVLAGRKSS